MVRNVRDLVTGVWTGEGEWRKGEGGGGERGRKEPSLYVITNGVIALEGH